MLWDPQGLARPWNMSCCSLACGEDAEMRKNTFKRSFAHNALRLQSVSSSGSTLVDPAVRGCGRLSNAIAAAHRMRDGAQRSRSPNHPHHDANALHTHARARTPHLHTQARTRAHMHSL